MTATIHHHSSPVKHVPPLSEILDRILSSQVPFTDIHIESGKEVMLRQSPYRWVAAQIDGATVTASHDQIVRFVNGIYVGTDDGARGRPETDESRKKSQQWRLDLHERGCLHPALNLSRTDGERLVSYRMRCTIQKQRMGESIGLVLRPLADIPKSIASLGLPFQVERMLKGAHRGMIIVTGPTGSGKSTTLAAMVGELNASRNGNILTIEDPVEFLHERNKCIVNQRELGIDVNTFADGVRDALRFVPDVILIGEVRDAETMKAAVRATESGHLVLASMHAPTGVTAIRKMLAYLGDSHADMQALGHLLVGVIAQALVPDRGDTGKNHLASEILDCRIARVAQAIVDAASGDSSQQRLATFERQVIAGGMEGVVSMVDSLRSLLSKELIDVRSATSAVTTSEEKEQLLKSQPQQRT